MSGRPDVDAVREEDRFDVAAVDAWLRRAAPGLELAAGRPEVRQFSKGASNLTYLLRYGEEDLILRRPPVGSTVASAHDMGREFRIQRGLAPSFPFVPETIALCEDPAVLGVEFYVMRRVRGTILRSSIPPELDLAPAGLGELCRSFVDRLVELHAVDASGPGLAAFSRGEGYVARQVSGWARRYRDARTWNMPSMRRVIAWLEANEPPDVGGCVIHNDFRFDNVVLAPQDPSRIAAVLDWELATVGDPLMDLGCTLAYWTEAGDDRPMQWMRRQPTHVAGMLTRGELVAYYGERSGRSIDDVRFYEVYGLFRLAAIIGQIYRRYHDGKTSNPTFRNYWLAVNYYAYRCERLTRKSRPPRGVARSPAA